MRVYFLSQVTTASKPMWLEHSKQSESGGLGQRENGIKESLPDKAVFEQMSGGVHSRQRSSQDRGSVVQTCLSCLRKSQGS